jgi:DNA-binding CsgD family transcriptional regulator
VIIRIDLEKDLSSRETEILLRIMAGDSTAAMAKRFFISVSTVKSLIQSVYIKLDVHNRGGATAAGFRLGLDPLSNDVVVSTPIDRTA